MAGRFVEVDRNAIPPIKQSMQCDFLPRRKPEAVIAAFSMSMITESEHLFLKCLIIGPSAEFESRHARNGDRLSNYQ